MGKKQQLFPKAVLPQVPTKGHCHQAPVVLLPGLPHQTAALGNEEQVRSRAEQMTLLQLQSRTNLPSLPDHKPTLPLPLALCLKHKATAAKTPPASTGTVTAPLPKLKHPCKKAKPSMLPKHNSRVTTLPSLCSAYRAKVPPNHLVTSTSSLSSQSGVTEESSSGPQIQARPSAAPSEDQRLQAKDSAELPVYRGNITFFPLLYSDYMSQLLGHDNKSDKSGSSSHSDHQIVPSSHASNKTKVSTSVSHQVSSLGQSHWTEEPPCLNYWAATQAHQDGTVLGSSCQTTSLPGSDLLVMVPSSLDHQESSLGAGRLTTLPPGQDDWTYVPLGLDHQYTTPQGLDSCTEAKLSHHAMDTVQKVIPNLEVAPDTNTNIMPPTGLDHLAVHSADLNHQAEEAILDSSVQETAPLASDLGKMIFQESDCQTMCYSATDDQAEGRAKANDPMIPLTSVLCHQESRTWGPNCQTKHPEEQENQDSPSISHNPQAEEAVPDPNIQETSLPAMGFEETMSLGSEPQDFPQHSPDQQIPPTEGLNAILSVHLTELEHGTASLQRLGGWAGPLSTATPKGKSPTICDAPTEVELKGGDQAGVPPELQDQILNRDAPCSHGIEPFNIERGIVPNSVVNAIISSIPREKIQIDLYKEIISQQKSPCPNNWPNQLISSSYTVCLICAAWIPNGCPHVQEMEHLFKAQLLAIPTPLHGSEENGVKLLLQIPQQKRACSILRFPSPRDGMRRPALHELLLSAHSAPLPPKSPFYQQLPERVCQSRCLHGKKHQLWRQKISSRKQPFKGESHMKGTSSKEEKSERHGLASKFFQRIFQRRRKN